MAIHPINVYSCKLILKLLRGNCFVFRFKVIVTLTFDLVPHKNNRGLLPNMDNHPMKFEYCGPKGT
jgi:hypothetical protein